MICGKNLILSFLLSFIFLGCTNLKENKDAQYFLMRGINLSQQGDTEKALACYRKSYAINPKDVVLLKELGYAHYMLKKYDEAEKYWLEALEFSDKEDEIIKNLITMYYENNRLDEALNMMDRSFNPNSEYLKLIKGLVLYRKGQSRSAYDILTTINKSSFDERTYIKFLEIAKENESLDRYYELLQNGEKMFENRKAYTLFYSEELTRELKKYDEAEEVLLKYLLQNGNDKEIILRLSWMYEQAGKMEKSRDSLLLLPKTIK